MTVVEVADLLQVSERHVYQLVQSGSIPHLSIGKAIRFDPDQLGDWLKSQSEGNASSKAKKK
jgi:excisionase family DNA binding protein